MIRLAALLALLCAGAQAQPSMEPLGPSILDTGSTEVSVHDFDLPAPGAPRIASAFWCPMARRPKAAFRWYSCWMAGPFSTASPTRGLRACRRTTPR
ncbi:hypothetical protein [Ponticoccus litoralis]|uniref:Uncharacterized protein n=1 Tax=Ponticoccus litoralis TaxID=422297 RepID=A0AAW9SKK9_9RHOB